MVTLRADRPDSTPSPAPLAGVQVVELGAMASAAACGVLLAAWGADVIKIEPPSGDMGRGAGAAAKRAADGTRVNPRFELHNRGKRSVAIDLADPRGNDVARELARDADVFVTNALPRVLAKYSLSYAALAAANERLVYGQISGYGLGGPDENRASFDHGAFWAQSGMAAYFGASHGGEPPQPSGGMGDRVAGALLAGAVCAALAGRAATGRGAFVSTSLLGAGIWMQGSVFSDALFTGRNPTPDRRETAMPTLNWFRTLDDRFLYLQVMDPERDWHALIGALEHPALCAGDYGGGRRADLAADSEQVVAVLEDAFASRTLAEWAPILDGAGIRWEPLVDVGSVVDGVRAREAGAFVATQHPMIPRAVADPVAIGNRATEVPRAPELGADTARVLRALGYDDAGIRALVDAGVVVAVEETGDG